LCRRRTSAACRITNGCAPTIKIQPDFQMIWDRVFHKDVDHATVFQIQLVLAW